MQIKWKQGSRVKAKANDAYQFLEEIRQANNGVLDLKKAVEASEPKDAPLHNDLEWDDSKAGDLYRQEQMRYIVRHIEVIHDGKKAPMRKYESVEVTQIESQGAAPRKINAFMSVEDALADPVLRAQLLQQAIRDIMAFKRRYAALSELSILIQTMDKVAQKLAM